MARSHIYERGAYAVGALTFVCAWIYAVATYGFSLGVGLGWIPAIVIGAIAGVLWPVLAFIAALAIAALAVSGG